MENKEKMLTVNLDLTNLIDQSITPAASTLANTLISLWGISFGNIDYLYSKISMKRQANLEKLSISLKNEIERIPDENYIEPKMNIVGPSFEALKYYFEEEHYREMFSKLISKSADSRFVEQVHPAFTNAIQELTHIDALILNNLIDRYKYQAFHVTPVFTNGTQMFGAYIDFDTTLNPFSVLASFYNLRRLGFLDIEEHSYHSKNHDNSISYKMYNFYESDENIKKFNEDNVLNNDLQIYYYIGGWVKLTKFGTNFAEVCVK